MQQSYDILFASSNKNKYREAKKILSKFGIQLEFFGITLQEIQTNSIKEVASDKVIGAFNKCKEPVIIEDDGLFIKSLNGFPGPYSSYIFKTIGNKGILQLVSKNRNAKFQSVIAYCDNNGVVIFEANVRGKISNKLNGKGWGFDPIFIPEGKQQTYAKITDKNEISHRYKALKKFSNWYVNKRVSNES